MTVPACHIWGTPAREELTAAWKAWLANGGSTSLPEPDDDALLTFWHDGRCAVCGFRDVLVEDHDWDTGLTRGYLCRSCNVREGLAGDEEPWAAYRANPPTRMLGMRLVYGNPFGQPTTRPQVSEDAARAAMELLHIPYVHPDMVTDSDGLGDPC